MLPRTLTKFPLSNAKAAAKQVRATRGQRRVARALASISVICGFLNQFSVPLLKHNLGAKTILATPKRLRGLCFFPNVSKNTCKHPPPNTRYISSAEFSKTAFVKNNPIKKAGGQGFLNLSRISFISGSERKTTARLSFRAWVKGTVCPSRALEYCPSRLSSAESFCGVL